MRTYSLIKDLPVFEVNTGKLAAEVCDLSISSAGRVEGILVKCGGLFKKTCFLDIHKVESFGRNGIMINDINDLKPLKNKPQFTVNHLHSLNGKMIFSDSGETIGLMRDVCFMEEVGTIVGYEVTDGFFSEISEGKKIIHTNQPVTIGKDTIIVNVKNT